jgi:hypothetical protein
MPRVSAIEGHHAVDCGLRERLLVDLNVERLQRFPAHFLAHEIFHLGERRVTPCQDAKS